MAELKVRKIDFRFGDDIPVQFNPLNPRWSNFVNYITLIGPGFERYFIRAIRDAMPHIKDSRVKKDADLFCLQEAQHSRHHLAHLNALTNKYSGLEETKNQILSSYDNLLKTGSLEFHLAYAATVELAFGPTAKFLVESRDVLFKGGDSRISSFILWHLIEEFEHRNAANDIYHDIVGSYAYRMKNVMPVFRHLAEVYRIAQEGLQRNVPSTDCIISPYETGLDMFRQVPFKRKLRYLYDLTCTLLPYHNPDNIVQPEWVTKWFADEAAGQDMTHYYQ